MSSPAARSALSTVTAILARAGFKAVVLTGRNRRPGYGVRDGQTIGCARGVVVFDYTGGNGEFPLMCEALVAAGYTLTDAEGGADYVARGCARARRPAAQTRVASGLSIV